VDRQLGKRVGAPYFMVTFTLPEELRPLFFTPQAKEIYQLFFSAASTALSDTLANPRASGSVPNNRHSPQAVKLASRIPRLGFVLSSPSSLDLVRAPDSSQAL
jgi:hypothetical protein